MMEKATKIILISLLLIINACEKVVTVTEKETVTVTDTVTVTETVIEKDTVQTASPVPSLPTWGTSTVRIGLIGDSISTFEGWIPEGYAAYYPASSSEIMDVSQTYWYRLIYDLMPDAVLDRNLAYSATRVAVIGTNDNYDRNDFVTRIDQIGFDDPDIVIIHGGTNDRRASTPSHVPLGDYGFDLPIDQLDRTCFRSSYVCMVRKIMERHPGVKIVCIIGDTLNTEKYQGLADSIKTIAEHYGFSTVSFTYALESADGVHPNASGAQYMADRIYEVMAQDGLLYYKK
jgi:lysophospholipase L1-like esterase